MSTAAAVITNKIKTGSMQQQQQIQQHHFQQQPFGAPSSSTCIPR
jgi:hypothetical protein